MWSLRGFYIFVIREIYLFITLNKVYFPILRVFMINEYTICIEVSRFIEDNSRSNRFLIVYTQKQTLNSIMLQVIFFFNLQQIFLSNK